MNFSFVQLNQLSLIAQKAVKLAGLYIEQFDHSQLKCKFKDSGSSPSSQVVTEVDLQSQKIIISQLKASCEEYDIALLSEENCSEVPINQHPRLTKDYFWCIDPLDGTLPFIKGNNGYAISVALVNKKGQPILSAIYLPASKDCYYLKFDKNNRAVLYKNQSIFNPISKKENKVLTFYCDQSFLNSQQYSQLLKEITKSFSTLNVENIKVISEHGAVVNALSVLENHPACYIKLPKLQQGGGAIWDFSGTASIFETVNGWVTDSYGLALKLNQPDNYYMNKNGVIYASDKTLGKTILKIIDRLTSD